MTWGMIIGSEQDYIMNSVAVTFPGLASFPVVLAIGLIGDDGWRGAGMIVAFADLSSW